MIRIALFLPSLAGGGAEKVFLLLAKGLADLNQEVDLVVANLEGRYLDQVDPRVNIVNLGAHSVARSFPGLFKYLRRVKPEIIISALIHTNCINIIARMLAGVKTVVILTEHNHRSSVLLDNPSIKERILVSLSRVLYPHANAIVCVSDGVADDIAKVTGMAREKLTRIYNPVLLEDINRLSKILPNHPWFAPSQPPVILAVGRLILQKDYETLLRGFALVRSIRPVHLLILGDGPEHIRLEALSYKLGVAKDVAMPGFVQNPFSFMAQCSVFTLSSKYEGFGNVIVEALACGILIIATDCPSGPREILQDGDYGTLIPPQDPKRMAEAILWALNETPNREKLIARAGDFSIEKISQEYLALFLKLLGRDV